MKPTITELQGAIGQPVEARYHLPQHGSGYHNPCPVTILGRLAELQGTTCIIETASGPASVNARHITRIGGER
jgi:hypothetical protein